MTNVIKVLIVDDSPTLRRLIRAVLETDAGLSVLGEARNGEEALNMCHQLQPDIITMDIRMPRMNGFEAIQRIMSDSPRPIVVLTTTMSDRELGISFKALDAGALSVIRKPTGMPGRDPKADELIRQLKAMADVKVVRRRWPSGAPATASRPASPAPSRRPEGRRIELIAIGASTGGPPVVQSILQGLPADLPVPVVLVQHISPGFVEAMARWLDDTTPVSVKVARSGERLAPGVVYLPPDEHHLLVMAGGKAWLDASPPVDGHRPSVTALFDSVAEHYGAAATAVLLTGMGRDGATGLKAIHDAGGRTIAQDEASCVVFGMPRAAAELGAADEILPPAIIAARLKALVRR